LLPSGQSVEQVEQEDEPVRVSDIMTSDVKTVSPTATFAEAARVLADNRISSVVVKDGESVAGIITERDVVHVVAEGGDPSKVTVGERMTKDLATVERKADLADAARLMGERRIRHLPVVDRGSLSGIVSIRDLTSWAIEEVTGGHELPDLERSSAALTAAVEAKNR
jgi:CBS domain-containing protein